MLASLIHEQVCLSTPAYIHIMPTYVAATENSETSAAACTSDRVAVSSGAVALQHVHGLAHYKNQTSASSAS